MDKVVYSEEQRFTQKWIINLLLIILAIVGSGIIWHLISKNHSTSMNVLVFSAVFVSAVGYMFVIARLLTQVTDKGISFQFFPFHNKPRTIYWQEVEKAYVRSYKPLLEYGGWGIRYGLSGKAYNVSGKKGLQLVLKNGRKILIGTQRPELLEEVMQKWVKL